MRINRTITTLALAAGFLAGSATVAGANPAGPNPAQLCRETNNIDGYLGSHGGCVSSVASIGVEQLMMGAFPSQAAAIANCKAIEGFVGGFPYYFYGQEGDKRYLATNYRTCVNVLYRLHTGEIPPVGS